MKDAYSYNKNLDPDMSMCKFARDNGHFLYIDNEKYYGFLIVSDEYAETVTEGKWHPEMWQIFENREVRASRNLTFKPAISSFGRLVTSIQATIKSWNLNM